MRLLHVTHQYRPAIGGAETYISDLSEELARRGHQVDVFTSRSLDYRTWRSELPAVEQVNGVTVRRFRSLPRTASTWRLLRHGLAGHARTGGRRFEPLIWYGNGPLCPGLFAAMMQPGVAYDVVHINNLHYAHAWLAAQAARLRGWPWLLTPHLHAEQPVTYDVGYLRTLLRTADALVAVTEAEKAFILDQGWNPRVVVGGNGLPLSRFPPQDRAASRIRFGLPPTAFVMLFLGRKTDYKGLDLCLRAFTALRRQRDDVWFLAVGPETDYSRALWAQSGPLEGLVVRDHVPDEERLAALAACDVLVMPSTGEAFGIVFLEAWAYSKPVIGARITAVASLVGEEDGGLLIEPGDAGALTRHLARLVADPALARMLGARGHAKLHRRYTSQRIGDLIEHTYRRVLRRHRSRQIL